MSPAPLTCPVCGKRELLPVVYGLPTCESEETAQRGEVMLGGCLVSAFDPEYACTACGFELPSTGPVS